MKAKKLIFSSVLFLFFFFSHAQLIMIDGETGEYQYEGVVKADGLSKQELFDRTKKWINLYYKNGKFKTDTTKTIKKLVLYEFSWKFISKNIPLQLIYDLEVRFKDGKYKYTISDLRIGKIVMGAIDAIELKNYIKRFPVKYQIFIEEPIDKELTEVIASLDNYIHTQKFVEDEDDW